MSRLNDARKNATWSVVSNVVSSLLHFLNRTIFIYTIGEVYLGINGLFTNIISLLSLTELGIWSAISFSLYKPLAEKDNEKIKSLMAFYRSAYRVIAAIVFLLGVALMPFLKYMMKGGEDVEHVYFIFFMFLITTVSSYLITYKHVLIAADQKNHLIAFWQMFFNIFTFVVQFFVLWLFKDYYLYLILTFLVNIFRYVFFNIKITKLYPLLREKSVEPLGDAERETIFNKVKALILHNIGEVCVNQTDNIIISAFIDIVTVGFVSNYYLITNAINGIIKPMFNSVASGLGNLVATESDERVVGVFDAYNYIAFLLYAWVSVALWFLINPFITIWIGSRMLITPSAVYLMIINLYMAGMLVPLANIKSVAGVFEQDKWVPIAQAVINLVVSIVGVQKLGLTGVYIGTFVSSLLPCIYRPIVVYQNIFHISVIKYYVRYFEYLFVIMGEIILVNLVKDNLGLSADNIVIWFLYAVALSLICFAINALLFCRTQEFKYLTDMVKRNFMRRSN